MGRVVVLLQAKGIGDLLLPFIEATKSPEKTRLTDTVSLSYVCRLGLHTESSTVK